MFGDMQSGYCARSAQQVLPAAKRRGGQFRRGTPAPSTASASERSNPVGDGELLLVESLTDDCTFDVVGSPFRQPLQVADLSDPARGDYLGGGGAGYVVQLVD